VFREKLVKSVCIHFLFLLSSSVLKCIRSNRTNTLGKKVLGPKIQQISDQVYRYSGYGFKFCKQNRIGNNVFFWAKTNIAIYAMKFGSLPTLFSFTSTV
jgi:hypothetical protein